MTRLSARIMLVDDEPLFLRGLKRLLAQHGHDVVGFDNAIEIDADEVAQFDLLITDIHMPRQTGLDLLRRLHENGDPPPVILMTGEPNVTTAVESLRLHAVDYVIKPLDVAVFLPTVVRAVANGRARRAIRDARDIAEEIGRALSVLETALEKRPGVASIDPLRGLSSDERAALTEREHEVMLQLVEGRGVKLVAVSLDISEHTVRNHMRSIYAKLGVHSQVELMRKALVRSAG